ncbi:hypothetical protein DVH05_014723 [Phytophthora capsici]|nr:hypothetical protein DVH05_014723 [Phytophthora capsici]
MAEFNGKRDVKKLENETPTPKRYPEASVSRKLFPRQQRMPKTLSNTTKKPFSTESTNPCYVYAEVVGNSRIRPALS